MKISKAVAASAALAAATFLAVAGAGAAETLDWVAYKAKGAGDPEAVTTQWFADELERRTNGAYKVRIHWGGSVATQGEIPAALQSGLGDIGDIVTPYFPDQLLVNNAIGYFWPQPNATKETGLLMMKWSQEVPQFAEEMAQYNIKTVGYRPLQDYGMICTKPVRTMEDFKGLRIRSYGFALPAIIEALGAVPVSMTTPESYEGLQRGILDCSPVGTTLTRAYKYDEVAKFFIEVPLGASWGQQIAINLDTYNAMSKDVQQAIDEIGREHLDRYVAEVERQDALIREDWKKTGVEVIAFPREDFLKAVNGYPAIEKVRQEWIDRAKAKGVDVDPIVKALSF